MVEILMEIAQYGIVFALLVAIIIYFYRRESKMETALTNEKNSCDARIDKLNKEVRDNEKENLKMLDKLADALHSMSESNKGITKDIDNLKEYIQIKLDSLK